MIYFFLRKGEDLPMQEGEGCLFTITHRLPVVYLDYRKEKKHGGSEFFLESLNGMPYLQ